MLADLIIMYFGKLYFHEGIVFFIMMFAFLFGLYLGDKLEKEAHRALTPEEKAELWKKLDEHK